MLFHRLDWVGDQSANEENEQHTHSRQRAKAHLQARLKHRQVEYRLPGHLAGCTDRRRQLACLGRQAEAINDDARSALVQTVNK